MTWLAGLLLLSVIWAAARAWRQPPLGVPATKTRAARPSSPPAAKPQLVNVPSLLLDEDDVEITSVTASPVTEPPSASPPKAAPSNVRVIYEDDAGFDEVTSPRAHILLSAVGKSHRGQIRQRNEDSLLALDEPPLFVVADGMGGYEGGQVASNIAVERLRHAFDSNDFEGKAVSEEPIPRRGKELACAIQMANHAIWTSARQNPALSQMGTTIVAARFSPSKQRVYIGHVGDSRCYRLRASKLRQLTTDHTMHELGVRGPGSQYLFQAVGISLTFRVDLIVDKPRPDDMYLLCSDGLPKMVSDEQIQELLLRESDMDDSVRGLIALANAQGGRDNVTVILIKVLENTAERAMNGQDHGSATG